MRVAGARTSVAGSRLSLLVLAADAGELIGIDLESGAFVRAAPRGTDTLSPFDIATVTLAGDGVPSPHAPEWVETSDVAERAGELRGRRAERYLRPLLHPKRGPLLGFTGPAVPFWTLAGDRPSVTLVAPSAGPAVVRARGGLRCRFTWGRLDHDLPIADGALGSALDAAGTDRFTGGDLTRVLGYRPHRVLVALSVPVDGHCYKCVAALVPKP